MKQEQLKKMFVYKDGDFIRASKCKSGQGKKIGWTDPKGYRRMQIGDKTYGVHQLVWLWHHGYIPKQIDHTNRVKDDNRIENLRETTTTLNCRNQGLPRNNKSGQVGVNYNEKTGKWRARIGIGMRRKHLGWFKTFNEARAARLEAEEKYGYSETHGKEAL